MRIQHNIMAMNAYRNLGMNNKSLSKNLEKLSSGYRINRAGDDAAGLAISEKMRSQIAGLDQAQKNAQSGINMIQTAEGALTEVHDMLNRMVTLATQAANGTYVAEDQQKIQSEIDALTEEIDRIATESNFNGQKLLNGELGGLGKVTPTAGKAETTAAVKAEFTVDVSSLVATMTAGHKLIIGTTTLASGSTSTTNASKAWAAITEALTTDGQEVTIDSQTFVVKATADKKLSFVQKDAAAFSVAGKANTIVGAIELKGGNVTSGKVAKVSDGVAASGDGEAGKTEIDLTGATGATAMGATFTVDGKTCEFVAAADDVTGNNTAVVVTAGATAGALATALKGAITTAGTSNVASAAAADGKVTVTSADENALAVAQGGKGLTLQIGASSSETITVNVAKMDAASLGIDGASINVGDVASANAAIDAINDAIELVSVQRSNLGAYQNRLEHTINNLGVMEENIQDAEATIRDTDIADEMMAYTKNNILIQSAQAMLAQANQVPQGVLQLMQ